MPKGVYQRTEEHRRKISEGQKGRKGYWLGKKLSEEHKSNLSKNSARNKYWLGKKRSSEDIEKFRKSHLGKKHSEEAKKKISEARRGKKLSEETRQKISEKHTGKKMSDELRKKTSEALKGRKISLEMRRKFSEGQKRRVLEGRNHLWKGGVTPINQKIRKSFVYTLWREEVFKRDNYTCKWCGKRGGRLHADHIKSFASFPELRFTIENGRTLCVDCHGVRHKKVTNNLCNVK